jgi:hypothetical protein
VDNAEEIHKVMDTAIAAVQVLTKDEEISDVEVEEIEQEPGTLDLEEGRGDWLVTVGYNRQKPRTVLGSFAIPQRTLKVVRVDPTGKFKSVKNKNPNT